MHTVDLLSKPKLSQHLDYVNYSFRNHLQKKRDKSVLVDIMLYTVDKQI